MEEAEFVRVMRAVVEKHCSEELVAFDVGGARWVERLFAGERSNARSAVTSGEFKFDVSSVEHVLQFIVLVNSAYNAVTALSKAVRKNAGSEVAAALKSDWRKRLVAAGLSEEKAGNITTDFAADLARLVGADHNGP